MLPAYCRPSLIFLFHNHLLKSIFLIFRLWTAARPSMITDTRSYCALCGVSIYSTVFAGTCAYPRGMARLSRPGWLWYYAEGDPLTVSDVEQLYADGGQCVTTKARFPLPGWRVTGFHYPSRRAVLTGAQFPLAMASGKLETGRPSTQPVLIDG